MERLYCSSRRQLPNPLRMVKIGGDRVATIGARCYCTDPAGSEWAVCARRAFLDSGGDGAGRWLGKGDGLARGEPGAAGLAEFPPGSLVEEGEAKGK
jgi:hypothetical protein